MALAIKPGDTIVISEENDHGFVPGTVFLVVAYGWYGWRSHDTKRKKKDDPEYLDCIDASGKNFHIVDFDCFELTNKETTNV